MSFSLVLIYSNHFFLTLKRGRIQVVLVGKNEASRQDEPYQLPSESDETKMGGDIHGINHSICE